MLNIGESNEIDDQVIAGINFGQCVCHPQVFSIFLRGAVFLQFSGCSRGAARSKY
jgi:hypothetical protein